MTEQEWWDAYVATLRSLPFTGDNDVALEALLRSSGYFEPRTGHVRPSSHRPDRAAHAAWRLRFLAPSSARELAAEAGRP